MTTAYGRVDHRATFPVRVPKLVARKYDGSKKPGSGRPRTSAEVQRLILEIARDNPGWGYTRILGALHNVRYEVDRILGDYGVQLVKLPARCPNLSAHAERFVRSIKSECLAQVIPLGERHLRRCVSDYVEHYHHERNHQGLGNELIERPSRSGDRDGPVECRERLGGVLRYCRRAA